ncbi:MAG TPA: S8 family serine peptidase [Longimicrobium sp.]|jgi:subtilisin family serine protease
MTREEDAGARGDAEMQVLLPMLEPSRDDAAAETTGRFIVIFNEAAAATPSMVRNSFRDVAGLRSITLSSELGDASVDEALGASDAVHFQQLGVALISSEEAMAALASTASDAESPILSIEPEYVARLLVEPLPGPVSAEYLRGYRDAVNHLYDAVTGGRATPGDVQVELAQELLRDTPHFTWGLQATRAHTSRFDGQGIRVAILDTGLDLDHPDFAGRVISAQSFVPGIAVQDVHGHGTHCIGTACGPAAPATGVRRYGVAPGAQIFVAEVFNNDPRPAAATGDVIAGIEWAVENRCRIASLSLGVRINQKIKQYEVPIRRALNAGTLVVAAAGNNAVRPGDPGYVEAPANADQALAVGAVDAGLGVAAFSARSSAVTGVGGIVNVAAPGVAVFSSFPLSHGTHGQLDGTSMAAPHAAGIAALWAQATGDSGPALWNRLVQSVRPLSASASDVGSGLVQAPQ